MALVLDGDNGIVGVLATNNDGDVIFDTNTLFVDAVENKVGIGTTSPVRQLHLASAIPSIRLEDTDVSGAYNDIVLLSTGELSIRVDQGNVQAGSSLSFRIDNTEKMRIDSSGRVGIGTDDPTVLLHAQSDTTSIARFQGSNEGNLYITNDADYVMTLQSSTSSSIAFNTSGGNERMRIHSEGYTELKSSDAYNQLVLTPSGTNAPGSINFNTPGTGRAKIKVQNNEYISILSNGNVGIGTTDPSTALDVNGTVTATSLVGSVTVSSSASIPSVGSAGTMYYNTTAGVLYISNGAAWVQSYKNPANGSSAGSAAEYGSDIIALGLGAGLYWLTGRVAANRPAQQVYVDADGWMLFYRHAGTGGSWNSTYEIQGDNLGELAVGTLTSPTQGLTDAGSSTAAGSRGVARLATDFIRSLGGDSASNNVYRITTGSTTAYITDAQWWSTADGSSDGYGRTSISCGGSYANRRAVSGTPDANRPMGSYNIYSPANVIPWYHGNNYSGGYNPSEGWHISATCWVREF